MAKRVYELMVLLKPDFDGESAKKREEVVKKLLGDGVTIKELKNLGKKQLAYEIKKQKEAVYLLAQVESTLIRLDEMNKRAKVDEQILRFLLLGKEDHGVKKSQ